MFEVSPIKVATILARMAKDALRRKVADVISRALDDVEMREMVMLRSYWRHVEKLRTKYPELSTAVVIAPGVTFCPDKDPVDEYELN